MGGEADDCGGLDDRPDEECWERSCPHALGGEETGEEAGIDKDADEDVGAPRNGAPVGWHTRGYLPHFESNEVIQTVTYRLNDSLPRHVAERLAHESRTVKGDAAYRKRLEDWLDSGYGACYMRDPVVAQVVVDSLRFFDGARYRLHAWVVMPNHVHVMVSVLAPHLLLNVVKGWKSFTARAIGRRIGRRGTVWQKDYWDRFIRDEAHYARALLYIEENPLKAGLAGRSVDWRWGSAWERTCLHALGDEEAQEDAGTAKDADEDVGAPRNGAPRMAP